MTDAPKKPRPLTYVVGELPCKPNGLSLADKSVLRALVDRMNREKNGANVFPSNQWLAEMTGANPDTVKKSKQRLHDLGFIKIYRDRGKSDLCAINEEYIRALFNPREKLGGSRTNPPENVGGYPPEKPGETPPKNHPLTAKEQQTGNNQSGFPFGCSSDVRVQDGPHQRKLAVHGVVAATTHALRSPSQEQPTGKTPAEARDEALQVAGGRRRARDGP